MSTRPHNKITTQMRILALCQIALVGLFIYHISLKNTYSSLIFVDALIFILLSAYIKHLLIVKKPNQKKKRKKKKRSR